MLEDVNSVLTAAFLREHTPSAEGAARLELINWCERINYAHDCGRLGLYMDVLTIPPATLELVSAELRSRGFFVSKPIDGSVRYDAFGSAFVVKLVYVNWNREDGQG